MTKNLGEPISEMDWYFVLEGSEFSGPSSLSKGVRASMSYVLMHSACANCGQVFAYNPHKVPSVRVEGERVAVCQPCIITANRLRVEKGLEPFQISEDAYEAIHESEL